jgi:hypothetical protein
MRCGGSDRKGWRFAAAKCYAGTMQLDLFGDPRGQERPQAARLDAPPDFVDRIRKELQGTLALAREAEYLPWSDVLLALMAEKRFHSVSRYLPEDEATALCEALEVELVRLYEAEDRRWLAEHPDEA